MTTQAPRDNQSYYDEFAAWYERERHDGYHRMIDDLEVDLLSEHVQGRDVLEVGCGTGLILHRVAQGAKRAVGIDISQGMLEQAQRRGLEVAQADVLALPFEDASFDVVYSFKVLAHVADIDQALREMARVTRPGGKLFLEFYNPWSLRYLAKRLAGPQQISKETDEGAVFTRWDTPLALKARMPRELEVEGWAGIRIFTPMASAHRLPLVRRGLRRLEFLGRDSPLRYFGGFLVAVLKRR